MQAVILVGGKGTRMGHLVMERPKPLLVVNGKTLLEHKIDALPQEVDEVILIIGHMGEKIMDHFGGSYGGRKVTYIVQPEQKGTAHALWLTKDFIVDEFISMMGDDIYSAQSIRDIIKHPWAMTTFPSVSFKTAGSVQVDQDGNLKDVRFDDLGVLTDTVHIDIGLYKLHKEIFSFPPVKVGNSEEYGLPHSVSRFVLEKNIPMKVVRADSWFKLNTPEDLEEVERIFVG